MNGLTEARVVQASAQPLVVQALVSVPCLSISPPGSLFFKPTCIGASSQRELILHNTSQVPLLYQVCCRQALLACCAVLCCAVLHCAMLCLALLSKAMMLHSNLCHGMVALCNLLC